MVATFGAQSVLDEPVRDVAAALALGPVLVLPTETSALGARLVDFEAERAAVEPNAVAQTLVGEAARGDAENIIAWRRGRRWLRRYDRLALPAADTDLPLKSKGVYLITGGLGGIGLTLAGWLARQCSARLLLTGRTALPGRAEWDRALEEQASGSAIRRVITAVRDIESDGGEVLVARADFADSEQMELAIELARSRWGEIDGVILRGRRPGKRKVLILKSPADVEAVLSPKVNGLAVLTRLLGGRPLDFVVLMSSINAVVGAPGACDYSAGNAVLDAFVDSADQPPTWRNVIALDWAAWRDVGMAANLVVPDFAARAVAGKSQIGDTFVRRGRGAFSLARDGRATGRRDPAQSRRGAASREGGRPRSRGGRADQRARARVGRRAESDRRIPTEFSLAEIWSELLGLAQIDPDADFFELGGHSLLATRMMSRIYDTFGVRISLRDVFDAPTTRKLALRIHSADTSSAAALGEDEEEREELIF